MSNRLLMVIACLYLISFGWAVDPDSRNKRPRLAIPAEFGFQPNQKTPYCVTKLREVNPETNRSYVDDIVFNFRQAYRELYLDYFNMDFQGSDADIDRIFEDKILGDSSDNSDYAAVLYKKFVSENHVNTQCLPESQIRENVERFMRDNLSKFKTLREDEISPLLDDLFKNGGNREWEYPYDGGIYINRRTTGEGITLNLSWGQYSWQMKSYISQLVLGVNFFKDYWHTLFPELSDRIASFKERLIHESKVQGGVSASEDGLFPGYPVRDDDLDPLVKLSQSGWTCGHELGMKKTSSYRSLQASAEWCGSIVLNDSADIYKAFHDFVRSYPGETILDIAGAIGANTLRHIDTNELILNDININELAVAYAFVRRFDPKHKGHLKLNLLSAPDLIFPQDSIRATFIGYLVKYLTGEQIDTLFKNVWQFTKPGGRLFIIELNKDNKWSQAHKEIATNSLPSTSRNSDPFSRAGPSERWKPSERWPNEWGYLEPGSRIEGIKARYFLHNLVLGDIKRALERAGFKIIEEKDDFHFWIIAEKPVQN